MQYEESDIREFWNQFIELESPLKKSVSADCKAYKKLLKSLQKIDQRLYIEFSANANPPEFIITADGNKEAFPTAKAIVSMAPQTTGWLIFALKPKIGFPQTTRWEDSVIHIKDVLFLPLESQQTKALGIRFFIKDFSGNTHAAHNAILRAIDQGVGEQKFAESISYTDVHALDSEIDENTLIALTELDPFIDHWNAKITTRN